MIRRFLWAMLTLASVFVIVTLAVANRHIVRLILDPFNTENSVYFVEIPLFMLILGCVITGLLLGGMATWLTQSKWRRTARAQTKESNRWRSEADRLSRERDLQHQAQLASSGSN